MGCVSKKDFSDLAGVSKAAVSKAIRENRIPVLPDGTIDADAPECASYIAAKKERSKTKKSGKARDKPDPKKKSAPRGRPSIDRPPFPLPDEDDISSAMDKLALERRKLAAQAQQLELKNAQIEGRLVAREIMIRGVWNPLETFLVRLLTDGSKTITSTAFSLIRSGLEAEERGEKGVAREEVEVAIREEISSLVKPLKRDIKRALFEDV
jgi:phage terminase Nu1 subunit (DNA packaging protein)